MTSPSSILPDLSGLDVVLVKSRFPENIGMVARACANMGAEHIRLVNPEHWQIQKAMPLATPRGKAILENIKVYPTLQEAIAPYTLVVGSTARTGGWRRELLSPEQAAKEISIALRESSRVAIVMGPEDKGLTNEEIECCQRLVTIPTTEASSLNVAQATLLLLYECLKEMQRPYKHEHRVEDSPIRITSEDQARLYEHLKNMLLQIDYLHGDNPDYFLMPLRRFLGRVSIKRHEYDALMGVCRQVRNKCK